MYPGDSNYEDILAEYLTSLFIESLISESILEIQNYERPIKLGASDYLPFTLGVGKTIKNKISLKQIIVETKDGFIFQNESKEFGLLVLDN